MRTVFIGFLFLLLGANFAYSSQDTSASAITKSQDMIQKEESLRGKLDKNEKMYLKKVVVTGVTLIDREKIEEILQPFKNHWISKNDIQLILDSITTTYKEKGSYDKIEDISYKINKSALHIMVKEKD
ncbi:MAG: POTRA domain-containing protein [Candidatus Omnitrophota bacterium]